MIDAAERKFFERMKALLEEQEALKADLAELKAEAEKKGGLTKERVGDLLAVAKLEVMDQAKRAAKDMQRKRRDELAGQLSMLDEPKKREPVTRAKPKQKPPEPPHDPETGEVIEAEPELQDDAEREITLTSLKTGETSVATIRYVAPPDQDLAAARRADFADDLEIPPYCDRRHEARRVPEAAE